MPATYFATSGFALVPEVLGGDECEAIGAHVSGMAAGAAGTRCLLPQGWCAALATRLQRHPQLAVFIPSSFVATQCTYFEKSRARNWLVAMHQDLSIPVAARVSHVGLRGWSEKEGSLFVQAPAELLQELVAVRLYIDDCTAVDGPLRVVAGSHLKGRISLEATAIARQTQEEAFVCTGQRGSVLVMRPLLLHASSKSTGSSQRRVLHFLFGPRELPHGLRWQHAV